MAKVTLNLSDADMNLLTWAVREKWLDPPTFPGLAPLPEDMPQPPPSPQTESEMLAAAVERYVMPHLREAKSQNDAEVMRSALKDADPQTVDLTHQAIAAVQRMPPDQQKALLQQVINQAPPVEENV